MNGKGDRNRVKDYKLFARNFENIEWRDYGTYCEECGANLKSPKNNKHWSKRDRMWVCNLRGGCKY